MSEHTMTLVFISKLCNENFMTFITELYRLTYALFVTCYGQINRGQVLYIKQKSTLQGIYGQ